MVCADRRPDTVTSPYRPLTATDQQRSGRGPKPEYPDRRREATNASPARPGLIAELCVAEDAVAARNTMSLVVNRLKKVRRCLSAWICCSEDLRRNLADPKVILPDRHFTLVSGFCNDGISGGDQ